MRTKALADADDLLARLQKAPGLAALAVNPLLLTMIANVHRYHHSLPAKRVELYAAVCDVLLSKRHEMKGITQPLSARQKIEVLQTLAYHMMENQLRAISRDDLCMCIEKSLTLVSTEMTPNEFLTLVEEASGLLIELEVDHFAFAHMSFQEYLAAVYLRDAHKGSLLVSRISSDWWRECIRLYCAQADATLILEACLVTDPVIPEVLSLAVECRDEAHAVEPEAISKLEDALRIAADSDDPAVRKLVGEALLLRRLR